MQKSRRVDMIQHNSLKNKLSMFMGVQEGRELSLVLYTVWVYCRNVNTMGVTNKTMRQADCYKLTLSNCS